MNNAKVSIQDFRFWGLIVISNPANNMLFSARVPDTKDRYEVFLFKFGSVVFWNFDTEMEEESFMSRF